MTFSDQLHKALSEPSLKADLVSLFLAKDCEVPRFIIGKNEEAVHVIEHISVDGVIDDFAKEIVELSDFECIINPIETKDYPLPAPRPHYSVLDKSKIKNEFNIPVIFESTQSIKAGKRIYYLDVKKNRKDEMFLAITESKKIVMGEGDDSQVSFEKHKIFLYKEDFEKFMNGLQQAIGFIQEQQGCYTRHTTDEEAESPETGKEELPKEEKASSLEGEIKIDIEF
jgi:hypothetical protein